MASDNHFNVDVVVPFADSLTNIKSLSSWLKRELIPINFRVILIHDVHQHDLASKEILEILNTLKPENYLYLKGTFGSPGTARNAGLRETTAEWICFWDSDDYPSPREFNSMIEAGIMKNSEICVGKFEIVNFQSRELVSNPNGNSPISVAVTPGFWRMAILKQSIGEVLFTGSRMGEDQLFLLSINFASLRWYRHNAVVYRYVVGQDSQLTNSTTNYNHLVETLSNSIEVCERKTSIRANLIYSIMQARFAVTILSRIPIGKTGGILQIYAKSCFSSPKKFFFGTMPAYTIVTLNLFTQVLLLIKHILRSKNV